MNHLVFRLYGAMASWGEIAVGENRHTATYPGKSAILGLLGAALGLDRNNEKKQTELATGYTTAIKLVNSGQLLKDYHTSQAPDSVGKFSYRTRRDELVIGKERLKTVLSSREYRTDFHAIVAVTTTPSACWTLQELKEALLKPKYHLYLGRKSCPLCAPLNPRVVDVNNFREGLDCYQPGALLSDEERPEWSCQSRWLAEDRITHYYWEGDLNAFSESVAGFDPSQVHVLTRYDQPFSRNRWQFLPRQENWWMCNREKD